MSAHPAIEAALTALGIERFVLAVHDVSFPARPDEDVGRGSPYSFGGRAFLRFARRLGFTGVQLGPQGKISRENPSPYDGALFAKTPLSIALGPLAEEDRWQGVLPLAALREATTGRPGDADRRAHHRYAFRAQEAALRTAFRQASRLADQQAAFVAANAAWLEPDGLYEILSVVHGTDDWRRWPDDGETPDRRLGSASPDDELCVQRRGALARCHDDERAFNDFCQFLVHAQHAALREEIGAYGLGLYGDLQVGVSFRDLWSYEELFLENYLMGAPPSRTNPDGQPWGYPVLDPRGYGKGDGPALRFVRMRLDKMLAEFDGVRIDHPHGLVCPWVYRADARDPLRAVQTGARLFDSPELSDHPELGTLAIARPEQLATDRARYADDWVQTLEPAQIERYAVLIDAVVSSARRHGRSEADVAAEVLSTCPRPLAAVLARHGMGRFRVTQKANPDDVRDPYRTAEAGQADWVMVGTHDTPPLGHVLEDWRGSARMTAWARYLAERLEPMAAARPAFAAGLARDPRQLQAAMFADLFVGPARRVSVFFADLFGLRDIYNRPGVVHPDNWRLRVPPDFERAYAEACARGEALDVPAALLMALRARGKAQGELVLALERLAHGQQGDAMVASPA